MLLLTAALFPVFIAMFFGRVWCGWMCPYHLLADAAAWLRGHFRPSRSRTSDHETLVVADSFKANISRYSFLAVGTLAAGAVGIPVLNYLSAPGILSTEAMILVKERLLSLEFAFIAVLFLLELLALPRFWCRLFCPTGAFIAIFRLPFTLRIGTTIRTPQNPCCKENRCSSACPMGLAPYREGNNLLCTNCGMCIDACTQVKGPGMLKYRGFQGS
jgi:ferredoxin-type protein NapH